MIKYKKSIGEKMNTKVVSSTDNKKLLVKKLKNFIESMADMEYYIDQSVSFEPDWEVDWSEDKETCPRGIKVFTLVNLLHSGLLNEKEMLQIVQDEGIIEIDPVYLEQN